MLVDKSTKIKHKNQFISKVYYQNKIIYESTVDITVDITVNVYFSSGVPYGKINFKINGKIIHIYAPGRVRDFSDTYQVEKGSIVSFEWERIPRDCEAIWDNSFEPKGTVVTESRMFSLGIQEANTGGDIM